MSLDTFYATITSNKALIPDADNTTLFEGNSANFEKSEHFQWKGPELTANVGSPIPIVYGRHKVAGEIINAYVETGENDTLNMLIALCEGPVNGVSNVKLNGTAIEEFYGVSVDDPYGENAEVTFKKGDVNQTVVREFGDIHSVHNLDVSLSQNEEYIYTTDINELMAFSVEFEVDQLYQLDENDNKTSWYFAVKVEYRENGSGDPWTFAGIHEVNKMSETSIRRFFKSEYLTPARYDIRVTKLSEDEGGGTRFGNLKIVGVDEIINLELQYPYVSLLGVRLVATQKLSQSTPNVTAEVEGLLVRIPDVRYVGEQIDWEDYYYDSSTSQFKRLDNDAVCTWDGTTFITAYSANPVWCLRDLLTNSRYGLGQFIDSSHIDDASFLASALYCEEGVNNIYGKTEKRSRLDLVADAAFSAPDLINHICSTFRGMLSISTGKIRLLIEKDEDYTQIFNMGNIVKNSFNMVYHSSKDIPNVLVMEFTNKDKDYGRDSIEVSDEDSITAGNPIRQQNIRFAGITRPSQLLREGKILLNKFKSNTRSIQFDAFTDALLVQPGDVFLFQHDVPQWSYGGRIGTGSTTSRVQLDKQIVLQPATTYKVSIRNNADDTIEERTVTNTSGTYDYVDVSSPFSFTPPQYGLWVVGEENNLGMQYRCTGLTRYANGVTRISAVQYTASAYDDSSVVMPDDDFSFISLDIPDVYGLSCEEQVTRENDGTIRDTILVSFRRPPNALRWIKKAVKFHIYYSDNNGGSWVHAGVTESEEYTITDPLAVGGTYKIAVVSEADSGEKNVPATSPQDTVVIQGWQKKPATPTGFYYSFTDVIELYWNRNQEPDLFGYEIRVEDADWGQDDAELIWRGNAEKFVVETPTARSGITYYIKAYNTSYKFSDTPASVAPQNLAPDASQLTYTLLFQKVFLLWGDVYDSDLQYYEIWQNDNDNWIGIETGNERLVGKVKGTSSTQPLPYETTYYRVRAVDALGGGAFSNTISVDQNQLVSTDLSDDIINADHLQANSVTAGKILAGQVQAQHMAVNSILAQSIDVEELSAISAHMGNIESGLIVGAVIKTSNFPYHTQINAAGLFSYDNDGNLRTKLVRGELCLIDPVCSECYTFITSQGQLGYHYPYGDTAYVKRVKGGFAQTGESVFLHQWTDKPEVTVSVNRLSSFKTANSESDQEWSVYADNFREYNNGGSDFGWAFDVHSKLVISGGTRPECIYLCNFDQTVTTINNTCEVLVKSMFQLWKHGYAPDHFCYGVDCYEIRYKPHGTGVWCSCEYLYTQPHSAIDQMKCTQIQCNTLVLDPCCWDIQVHRISLDWYDSGIESGYTECLWCCYQYTVDCSYMYWQYYSDNQSAASIGLFYVISFQGPPYSAGQSSSFPGPPPGAQITGAHGSASVYAYGWFGGGASGTGWSSGAGGTFSGTASWSGYQGSYSASVYTPVGYTNDRGVHCYSRNIRQTVCWRCCLKCCVLCCLWCCYQYENYVGNPDESTYEKLYSTTEVTDEEIILDGAGTVNYLAVAYS